MNLSRAAEAGIRAALDAARADAWAEENRAALESSNSHVDRHGLPLAGYRAF